MKLRTEIKIPASGKQIDHRSKLLLMGSCFSEHMEKKFDYFKFQQYCNPYGILFHPLAIERSLAESLKLKNYDESDLIYERERWMSLNHHSKFTHTDKDQILHHINTKIQEANLAIKKASHIIITLGTAWTYKTVKEGQTVANCHKIPQNQFHKELLTIDQIKNSLGNMMDQVQQYNQEVIFIFTLSPVRHLKDGMVENARSKARLLEGIHSLIDNQVSFYFPSYEIMMDDLRDYRFYTKDLLHPNELAIDYIWTHFVKTWMNDSTQFLMEEIEKIQKSLEHKPFDSGSKAYKIFQEKLQEKINMLKAKHPEIKF